MQQKYSWVLSFFLIYSTPSWIRVWLGPGSLTLECDPLPVILLDLLSMLKTFSVKQLYLPNIKLTFESGVIRQSSTFHTDLMNPVMFGSSCFVVFHVNVQDSSLQNLQYMSHTYVDFAFVVAPKTKITRIHIWERWQLKLSVYCLIENSS
jgi:hypothetical protein